MGAVHFALGDLQQAKECHDRAQTMGLKKLGPEYYDVVAVTNSYNNLGPVHQGLGDLKQENECHDRALNICLKELGPAHVNVAYS